MRGSGLWEVNTEVAGWPVMSVRRLDGSLYLELPIGVYMLALEFYQSFVVPHQ